MSDKYKRESLFAKNKKFDQNQRSERLKEKEMKKYYIQPILEKKKSFGKKHPLIIHEKNQKFVLFIENA